MPDTSIDLDIRGIRIRARLDGPQGAPACVLLHGWLDTSASFDRLAPLLHAAGMRTIALDARGHGDSSWVGAGGFYHFVEYIADLDAALDALSLALPVDAHGRVRAPVRIVGHSMGASIALLYAAARPGRVSHLTLLDGIPMLVRPSEVPGRVVEYLDDLKAMSRARKTVASFDEGAARLRKTNPFLREDAAILLARAGISADPAQSNQLAWKWDPWLRAHSPLPFTEDIFRELLPTIHAPTLILRAAKTWLPDEPDLRERLTEINARCTIDTIAETSHHLHIESPEEVSRHILAAWKSTGL